MPKHMSHIDRFFQKVYKTDTCWIWTGARLPTGHGYFKLHGRAMKAARALWILTYGPLTTAQHVCHTCDVAECVNPDHLYLGNHRTNMSDTVVRRRRVGERNGHAKLTWGKIGQIRELRSQGTLMLDIARQFGITKSTVHRIVSLDGWN